MAVYQCLICGNVFKCSYHGFCAGCELVCFLKEAMDRGYYYVPYSYGETTMSVCESCTEMLLSLMRQVFQIKEDRDGVP